nr:putative retrotransposon Ty1-copia subclass protein [Tanacetum cinerariifolium]
MRIGVSSNVVAAAASLIGCSILTTPFNYFGVKVGSNMSRITSWDDVISKVSSRLSKWKLKLLSIGGRLSLLKSVLTSIPLYHMSIFKVPIGMLNDLESIRRYFFYGVDGSHRKLAWIGWNMVLTSKKNGGALDTHKLIPRGSPWQDVIPAIHSLQSKEVNGRAEELKEIQDKYTSPSEITNEIPMEVEEVEEHSLVILNEPNNYKAAILDPKSDKWVDSMNAEMQSMKDNQVWCLVDFSFNCKTIGSKWLFKKKTDMNGIVHTYKAHLVAKGYTQTYGVNYEETFSHVADIRANRIFIAISAFYNYEIWQMDVKTAFLHGYLNKDIYMVQPKVGSIMYAVRCTRPDVAYVPDYGGNTKAELRVDCYCDVGFETNRDDIKSQTGYVSVLNRGAVDWKSSKQSTTAIFRLIKALERKDAENGQNMTKYVKSAYRRLLRCVDHITACIRLGVSFCQEDAWAILKFHPKWDAPEQVDLTEDVPGATQEDLFGHDARPRPAGKPRPAIHPKWDAPEQVDLTEDVPGATQEDLFGHDARPRPAGKPRPAKKTKSDATASTGGSSASTQFGELMEQELRLKREAVERAFEA